MEYERTGKSYLVRTLKSLLKQIRSSSTEPFLQTTSGVAPTAFLTIETISPSGYFSAFEGKKPALLNISCTYNRKRKM